MSEPKKAQHSNDLVIPDKLYFRIGEVARLLGVETHTLRFWETEFPQLKVGKGGTGQRLYRHRDVELLVEIKRLLYDQGYTIPGARQLLGSRHRRKEPAETTLAGEAPASPEPQSNPELRRETKLARVHANLRELSELLSDGEAVRGGNGQVAARADSARLPGGGERTPMLRRGLHLATRQPGKPSAFRPHPGLFDPDPE